MLGSGKVEVGTRTRRQLGGPWVFVHGCHMSGAKLSQGFLWFNFIGLQSMH